MNLHATVKSDATSTLIKKDPTKPVLIVVSRDTIAIRAGTQFGSVIFDQDTIVEAPVGGYEAGADYAVVVTDGIPRAMKLTAIPTDPAILGGYHFAPGGNATARSGGDTTPAINPCSCWDSNFRPACPDPRGKMLNRMPDGRLVWGCIYMLPRDHLTLGASAFRAEIADGDSPPQNPKGGYLKRLDYATAVAVLAHHGLQLMTYDEARAFAHGVTERSSAESDPKITGLDAPRTSATGGMQMTGNLWIWITDGDPDNPRPSLFGGSWISGSNAGSRYADLDSWPGGSRDYLGARGRSDHLQLA